MKRPPKPLIEYCVSDRGCVSVTARRVLRTLQAQRQIAAVARLRLAQMP